MSDKLKSQTSERAVGRVLIRRSADGSFRVDESSLRQARGIRQQAEEAHKLSASIRKAKPKA